MTKKMRWKAFIPSGLLLTTFAARSPTVAVSPTVNSRDRPEAKLKEHSMAPSDIVSSAMTTGAPSSPFSASFDSAAPITLWRASPWRIRCCEFRGFRRRAVSIKLGSARSRLATQPHNPAFLLVAASTISGSSRSCGGANLKSSRPLATAAKTTSRSWRASLGRSRNCPPRFNASNQNFLSSSNSWEANRIAITSHRMAASTTS
mmetsp:Transcript_11612/g.25557  ORF Transcript_11612/g.25557 Transcript_11612/m.25557 type:complete len:204 (+) Transcript_11612:62-673(+)